MNEEELKKDILYDIEMQLYMEFNDKISTMNDYLGEIYSYKDIEDVKQAEQIRKIVLMEIAIKDLQQRIDKAIKDIETFKDDIKKYQEQDRINHQNISIGLVGIRLNTFLKDLKGSDK